MTIYLKLMNYLEEYRQKNGSHFEFKWINRKEGPGKVANACDSGIGVAEQEECEFEVRLIYMVNC